jgi:uncharacterized protein with HEPN domain/predicted nucleotidyltransferase
MDIAEVLIAKRQEILQVAARHGARNIRVFGSIARGESTAGSDVDLLVDIEPDRNRSDLENISKELAELLGCRVDVATEADLRPRVRQRALEEAIPLEAAPSSSRPVKGISRMRRDRDRLLDIMEAIEIVQKYTPREESLEDYLVQTAVVHNVQTIGEAASKLSKEFRLRHGDIPWPEIISMRNKIVHGYFEVNMKEIKQVVQSDLPELQSKIRSILDSFD